jgi:DNA polymerase III subunit beta
MKLKVTQENLSKALGTVARVANTRGTLPILSNVLIKTVNNRLSIAATNLDIAITYYTGAKVSEEGAITVPARLMQDFVGSLPGGVIELELDDYKLHVSTDQYKSTINGVSAEEYPVMPAIDNGKKWSVAGPELKRALQQVVMAASSDESRPVLTGVYIHAVDGNIFMAATDSYRLAEKRLAASGDEASLLVPVTAMQDVLRIVNDYSEVVEIGFDDQQVLFKVGDAELVARLIEGTYPDYRKLIPGSFGTSAVLARTDLLNVVKVSSLFARESAGSITIEVDEAAKSVSVRSVASQIGENTATATGEVTGSGSIVLNSRYLLDALHALSGEKVVFSFNGKLEPVLLRDQSDDGYMHIVMPLKS